MPDMSTTVIIQGKSRFEIEEYIQTDPYYKAKIKVLKKLKKVKQTTDFIALIDTVKDVTQQVIRMSPNMPQESQFAIKNVENPTFLINFIASNMNLPIEEKQKILEESDIVNRANLLLTTLSKELQVLEIKNSIQNKVKLDLDKQQRDYILNQQLKTILEELGGSPFEQQINEMKERAANKKWKDNVKSVFERELMKLQRMNPTMAEHSMQMNYVETILDLPWDEYTNDNYDLDYARQVLDEDHYGLEKVKERILEYLAVLKLKGDMKSPILCLVGPPGVGKTSLGRSVARALGRSYVRVSLGGVHDEAEIRGHRRTYIGAMPGKIIQSIKKAKTSNPVFVLDEIDKIGTQSIQGDPSSAMLEVLDPEQNITFMDNFLDIEYDLSKVLFIATANDTSTIQKALLDRMEIIEVPGYVVEEKINIARNHLIPKQLKEHGLTPEQIIFEDSIIKYIIEYYTRESGVRTLERTIAKIIRNIARKIASNEKYNKVLKEKDILKILGPEKFLSEKTEKTAISGVVMGLAWTSYGGDVLFIEASTSVGKGDLSLTGNLGDIMKESANLAFQYIKSNADKLNIDIEKLKTTNIHIHVPEGATPKDGPSAGVTIFIAMLSALKNIPVNGKIAMTGEITLRGKILPVGGIKEKILAAKRSHIKDIILPVDNKKDVDEIKQEYLKGLKIHYVLNLEDVINIIFD